MKIKFCTPYYNEFAYDQLGNITYNPDCSPPAEKSINNLVQLAQTDDIIYKPGTLYETPWFSFSWQRCRGTYIAEARNALVNLRQSNAVKQTLPEQYDYYITLDSDISFTSETIVKLIDRPYDIVGAAYPDRVNNSAFVGGWFEGTKGIVGSFVDGKTEGLVNVDWVGMGLCCIHRNVFETMPFPWFDTLKIKYRENNEECVLRTGEDVGFCLTAYRCGYSVYMDCDCVVEHHTV